MQSFYSAIAGAEVRWHEFPGQDRPVVFIHGLACASSYEYPPIVTDPGFKNRRALLIDLPGFGYSDKPLHFDYSITHQAEVMAEWLKAKGFTEVDLFGHSMGGSVAIQVAELMGKGVKTLVVSEPNYHSGGGFYSRKVVANTEERFVDEIFRKIMEAETSPWKGCLQSCSPHAMWRGAKSLVEGVSPSWMSRFLALTCHKALVFGEQSLPDADAEAISREAIPLHIVPAAGHSMSWENPTGLAAVLGHIFAQNGS